MVLAATVLGATLMAAGASEVAAGASEVAAAPAPAAISSRLVEVATLPPTTRRRIPTPLQGFKQIRLVVVSAGGRERVYCAALADQPASQQRGMMGRRDLGGHDAMVFLFETEQQGGFWMRTVPVGLDIAWFSGRGRWVDATTMAPCGDDPDCPIYPADAPYQFAVETLVGDAKRLGLVEGSRIRLDGRCR
jgi:hypothetical protein